MKEILSSNIARYRKASGLTQEELAKQLNISYQAVSKRETGQTKPDVSLLTSLAMLFNISMDRLFGYSAFQDDTPYYENEYLKNEYYWGITPSQMCLSVLKLMPPVKHLKLIDIGCGEGKDAVFFARCGYDVTAFDISDAGLEKLKRLADASNVHVHTQKADICDYRLECKYDILFSSGVLHYINPELRSGLIENYRENTADDGMHFLNAFVEKPFISPPPEKEKHSYMWKSGQLFTFYHDWLIEDCREVVFDCNSSGIAHKHAMNTLFAKKVVSS